MPAPEDAGFEALIANATRDSSNQGVTTISTTNEMAMDTMEKDTSPDRQGCDGEGVCGFHGEVAEDGLGIVHVKGAGWVRVLKTFGPARHRYRRLSLLPVLLVMMACDESNRTPDAPSPADGIRDSAALFRLITQTDPLTGYVLFPNADEFTAGRLNGSEAHRSIVRVSMNARAFGALQSGRLPTAAQFPDGSILLKEIRPRAGAPVSGYAVMYKDAGNSLAGDRWLWAEFSPDGSVAYSVSDRGTACTSCHQREQGRLNDLVRTFERQR